MDQVMTVRDRYARHVHFKVQFDQLHPAAQEAFTHLAWELVKGFDAGETTTLFLPFEGYRNPLSQILLVRNGRSKAGPWKSPHNYGLAVDFVACRILDGGTHHWTWDDGEDWNYLATMATRAGLVCQTKGLEWVKPHVQHRLWYAIRDLM